MKIWSRLFLVLATGMMMFSSCLENIEPEGLNDLRTAKADLLRAQTALQEAQAAKVNAEAALVQAEAKVQEAIAQQEAAKVAVIEAQALLAQYQAEYQALVNTAYESEKAFELEQAIAAAEAAKAEAELAAQKAAAQLEVDLLAIQTELLNAQAAYEVAMKNLAAAKVTLTPAQLAYIAPFDLDVKFAQEEVYYLTNALEAAAEELAAAIATVEEQKADKFALRLAEKYVVEAEATLAGAMEAAEIAKAALELDPKVTDWVAEMAELEAKLDAMKKEKAEGAFADDKEAKAWKDSIDVLIAMYEEYENATGYEFDEINAKFTVYPVMNPQYLVAEEIYVPSPKDEDGQNIWWDDIYYQYPRFKYGDADANGVIYRFESEIEGYKNFANPEVYESDIESFEATIEGIQKNNEDLFADYEKAVAAYNAGDVLAYFKDADEDTDIETPVAEYNAALEAFVEALDTYNAEHKKYAPADNTEAGEAAYAELQKASRDAYATYAKARQTALDVKNAAWVTWRKAQITFDRAGRTWSAILDAAVQTVGALETYAVDTDINNVQTDLDAAIKNYEADKKAAAEENDATFDADGKYAAAVAVYKAELLKVQDAQKAYDDSVNDKDATDVYQAALTAWEKAEDAYDKALEDASEARYKAVEEASTKYVDLMEDLNVNPDEDDLMDNEYRSYLNSLYSGAYDALLDAIYDLETVAVQDDVTTEVNMGDEDYMTFVRELPAYLVDEETLALKSVKVADVVDAEYFLETVKEKADELAQVAFYYIACYDSNGDWKNEFVPVVIGAPENYPLELPTYESYNEAYPEDLYSYVEKLAEKRENELRREGCTIDFSFVDTYKGPQVEIFEYKNEIVEIEEDMQNLDLAAEHVKTLEAAMAEFEAYVAAEEARIDALRTKVEAEWPGLVEQFEEMQLAQEAYEAEFAEIESMVDHIAMLIGLYLEDYENPEYTGDFDAFVEGLEAAYAAALEDVDQAEFDLEVTKDLLEKTKAGDVEAVELAQAEYDKVAAKLAEALEALETAAAELEKAMAAIGEGTVVEDAPAAPETPAE